MAGICKEGTDGEQDMGFLKHGHHSHLLTTLTISLVA